VRNISAILSISMDGVIQAPSRPDEDTRGGLGRGGRAMPYNDEVMAQRMGEGMASSGAVLLDRRTYEDFYGYWPQQTDNPFTPYLNQSTKYVVSSTLFEPRTRLASWRPSGSAQLVRSLLAAKLIDRYTLLIHPLVLGQGDRLFDERGPVSISSSPTAW
jgi:dihydrofolate reductase